MTTNTILELSRRRPFRRFSVETVGGSWIGVEHEDDILVNTRRDPRVVIFDPDGGLYILEPDQISAIRDES